MRESYIIYSEVLFATYAAKRRHIWPTTDLVRKVKKKVINCIDYAVREAKEFHPMCLSFVREQLGMVRKLQQN